MCNYCGSTHKKYGYCLKCHNEICEDCAALITSRFFDKPKVHKAGHCWGYRYSQIFNEVKKKSKSVCQQSKGTPVEGIACAVQQEIKTWKISDSGQMTKNVETLIFVLNAKIPDIESNKPIRDKIKDINSQDDLVKVLDEILIILGFIQQTIVIKGDIYMGDVFKNINGATIINDSIVKDSFNKVEKEHGEEVAKALLQIGEFIEKFGDLSAGILFDKFNEELNKNQPEKATLKKIWDGIEKTLPTIATISEVIAKIAPLF